MKKLIVFIVCIIMVAFGYFSSLLLNKTKEVQIVSNDFEYEKDVLFIIKKLEIQNFDFKIKNQNFYWGTDSGNQSSLKNILNSTLPE